MKTRVTSIVLILAMLSSGGAGYAALSKPVVTVKKPAVQPMKANPFTWMVNGKKWTPKQSVLLNGVSMTGTDLFDQLGIKWTWDAKSGVLTAQENGNVLQLTLGKKQAVLNGSTYDIPGALTRLNNQLYVPVRPALELLGLLTDWNASSKSVSLKRTSFVLGNASKGPQKVGSVTKFKELVKAMQGVPHRYALSFNPMMVRTSMAVDAPVALMAPTAMADGAMPMAKSSAVAESAAVAGVNAGADSAAGSSDYSKTNVQVEGVDEADVVKTDGQYIYQVNRQRVLIVKATPTDQMTVMSIVKFADSNFNPNEVYVDGNYLTVIGNAWVTEEVAPKPESGSSEGGAVSGSTGTGGVASDQLPVVGIAAPIAGKMAMPYIDIMPVMSRTVTRALVFNISNRQAPELVRQVEVEGDYISSRKIGDAVYLVTNKWLDTYRLLNEKEPAPLIQIKDNDQVTKLGCSDIYYLPETTDTNLMQVAGFRLDKPDQDVSIVSYLGSGSTVYASMDHLFVAAPKTIWKPFTIMPVKEPAISTKPAIATGFIAPESETITNLFKFKLDNGSVSFLKQGSVKGTLLNQFSLDEFDGNLRVAVTTGNMWEGTSANHLVVMNADMEVIGQLAGLAKGEKIYSVRFMGKRAYIVTFKKVDPLFVIGLEDPTKPEVLGELKIPGYSDYLHPYDENHLIGMGKDAVEADGTVSTGINGASDNGFAYYLGVKVAIFDVTDVKNPKEMFTEQIGDRGTNSDALYNHKAFLFSKEKGLLAFPVDLHEVKNQTSENKATQYGEFTFQGAYVYKLDLEKGFQLKGRISHLSANQLTDLGGWYDGLRRVDRILYIGNNIYTLSQGAIQSNDWNTMNTNGRVDLP